MPINLLWARDYVSLSKYQKQIKTEKGVL